MLAQPTFPQGSLTPPGPPAPTFKTLDQVEPRTPISALFLISQPGSYYFTRNVTADTAGVDGIIIQASDVTVDLNGFELLGSPGSLNGIIVNGAAFTNICVRNGTVRGWGLRGVSAGSANGSLFENLIASKNGTEGLRTGNGCVVRNCIARDNPQSGVSVSSGTVVIDCAASFNLVGLTCGSGCTIRGCAAIDNIATGIVVVAGCSVSDCTVDGDGITPVGIFGSSMCQIRGCAVRGTTTDGIRLSGLALVADNVCDGNTGSGIHAAGGRCRIEGNSVTLNGRGIETSAVAGTTNLVIRNSAGGNTTNYAFSGAVIFGPTNNLVGAGGVITNQNPWANFSL